MSHFGIPPCRPIGAIKNLIKDAILDGHIENDAEAAQALMERFGPVILAEWKRIQERLVAGEFNEKGARDTFDAWLETMEVSPSSRP